MKRSAGKGLRRRHYELLERRECLAISASLVDGLLSISGTSDGAIDFSIDPAGDVVLTDAGAAVDLGGPVTISDLSTGVNLTLTGDADDTVSFDLGGESVDRIFADLGGGANLLTIANGTIEQNLTVRGGAGDDTVDLNANVSGVATVSLGDGTNELNIGAPLDESETLIAVKTVIVHGGSGNDHVHVLDSAAVDSVLALLGAGDNTVLIEGDVVRSLAVHGSRGDDTIDIAPDGAVGQLFAFLGSGNNIVNVALDGFVTRSAFIHGGHGDDAVAIDGFVDGRVLAHLGGGNNSLTLNGSTDGGLTYFGGHGRDTVELVEEANINGSAEIHLGGEENSLNQAATISGNLLVFSNTQSDAGRIVVDESVVDGRTHVKIGRPRLRDLLGWLFDHFRW
jgi:hypothetical protein